MKRNWWEMDNVNFLEQEEALQKLNAELELRTRQLIKDVTAVITKDDSLWESDVPEPPERLNEIKDIADSLNFPDYKSYFGNEFETFSADSPLSFVRDVKYSSSSDIRRSGSCDTQKSVTLFRKDKLKNNTSLKKSASRTNLGGEYDEIFPPGVSDLGSDGLMRFLRTKVKMLQAQVVTLQHDYSVRTNDMKKAQAELKQTEEDKTRTLQDLMIHKEKLRKQEHLSSTLLDKLQVRDTENGLLKKELGLTKQELKKAVASSNTNESKLNKAKEEIENLKRCLKKAESSEKEGRDTLRVKSEESTASIRKLEKQKSELMTAFKKQLTLIDNLKRQKELMQMNQSLRNSEEGFLKLLDT